MTRPEAEEDDDKPLDPSIEKVRRKMVRFMGINLGILFLALMVVIAALVYKSRTSASQVAAPAGDIQAPAGQAAEGDIVLPVGARIVSQSISGNRISLDAELAGGERVLFVYDIAEQRLVGRFTIRNR
ncbi:fimbrial protein [Aquamicrobium lusatiense]|uniref:fimbrial protein n=1 Tax=Aquamicrobium lusatiense TaxID=89772 RepID=UPI0024561C6F|nr:fimbrial protein [Aquamicrobium lusatiense]MDH4991606.1 fimbrial protein [Aquamicrobium lusatiense]